MDVIGHVQRAEQRTGGPGRDRDVGPAEQRQDAQAHFASCRGEARIARDRGHRQQLELRPGQAERRAPGRRHGQGRNRARTGSGPVIGSEYAQDVGHAVRCAIGADRGEAVGSDPAPSRPRPDWTTGDKVWRRTHAQALRSDPVRGSGHHRRRVRPGAAHHRAVCGGAVGRCVDRRRRGRRPTPRRSSRRRASRHLRDQDQGRSRDRRRSRSTTRASTSQPTRAWKPPRRPRRPASRRSTSRRPSQSDYATNIAQFTDSGSNVVIGVGLPPRRRAG